MSSTCPSARRSRRRGRCGCLLLAPIILGALAWLALQTPAGRNWLAKHLASQLEARTGQTVRVEGSAGNLVRNLTFERVTIGSMLDAEDIELEYAPFALIRKEIAHVGIGRLELTPDRLPPPGEPSAPTFTLASFRVDELAVRDRPERAWVEGDAHALDGNWRTVFRTGFAGWGQATGSVARVRGIVQARIRGRLDHPEVTRHLGRSPDIALNATGALGALSGHLACTVEGASLLEASWREETEGLDLNGTARPAGFPLLAAHLSAHLPELVHWEARLPVPTGFPVRIPALRLTAPGYRVGGELSVGEDAGLDFSGNAEGQDITMPDVGRIDGARFDGTVRGRGATWEGRGRVQARGLSFTNLPPRSTATLDGVWTWTEGALSTRATDVDTEGLVAHVPGDLWPRLGAQVTGSVQVAAWTRLPEKVQLTRPLHYTLRADGTPDDLKLGATWNGEGLRLERLEPTPFQGRADLRWTGGAVTGTVSGSIDMPRVQVASAVHYREHRLRATETTLRSGEAVLEGTLTWASDPAERRARFRAPSLDIPQWLTRYGIPSGIHPGDGEGRIDWVPDATTLSLRSEGAAWNDLRADTLHLVALLDHRSATARLHVDAAAIQRGNTRLCDHLAVEAGGDLEAMNVNLTMSRDDDRGRLHAAICRPEERILLDVASATGTVRGVGLGLQEPVSMEFTPSGYRIQETVALSTPGGRVHLSGTGSVSRCDLRLDLRQDLAVLSGGMVTGRGEANLVIAGAPARPVLSGSGKVRAMAVPGKEIPEVGDLDLQVIASGPGRLRVEACCSRPPYDQLQASLATSLYDLDHAEAELTGTLLLAPFLPGNPEAPRVTGQADLDLRIAPLQRRLDGAISLRHIEVAEDRLGVALRAPLAQLVADQGRLRLLPTRFFGARDGHLDLAGAVSLSADRAEPLVTFEASLTNFWAVQRDDLQVRIHGRMAVEGGMLSGIRVAGALGVDEGEISLHAPPRLAMEELTIVRHGQAPTVPRARSITAPPTGLDLRVTIPGKLFVRGRGLESEWQASLHVKGTAREPEVVGLLEVRRGSMALFGRNFSLDPAGSVEFLGPVTQPRFDLKLRNRRQGIESVLHLGGGLQRPSIQLTTEPPLPEDEALLRLVTGSDGRQLSAMQAFQLGRAALALRGGQPLFSLMDQVRTRLPVDSLNVGESSLTEEGMEVEAGKYLPGGLYLGATLETRARTENRLRLEYQLTPRLSIETDVRSDLRSGIGFNWRRDF